MASRINPPLLEEEDNLFLKFASSDSERRENERIWGHMPTAMQDCFRIPTISEIMVNGSQILAEDLLDGEIREIGHIEANQAEGLIRVVAHASGRSVSTEQPVYEGELVDGSRFSAILPPIVAAPVISIRRRATRVFTLAEYVESGIMTDSQRDLLESWIVERKNIVAVGGTASGKTTLLNGICHAISVLTPKHRLIILEDTVELQCHADNVIQLRSTKDVPLHALVKTTLRHRPDRILVGEVRGKEAFDLLTAWSTGHPGGLASIHANSAKGTFLRLEQLMELATGKPMRYLIGEAIDGIIYIEKTPGIGRQVKEMLTVDGFDGENYRTTTVA